MVEGCFLVALDGHAARADLLADGRETATVGRDYGNLRNHRNSQIAPKFMRHEHLRSPHHLQHGWALHWFVKNCIDPVLGVLHRLLRAATQPVNYHLAIGSRSSHRVHDQLSSRAELQYAGFKLLPWQTLHRIVGHNLGFNSKLFEAVPQNFSGRFLDVNQGHPGGKLSAARYGGNGGFQGFVHSRNHSVS